MASIEELLGNKREPERDDVQVELGGELVTFRFTEMPGEDWAEATTRNPVRLASPIDRNYGYNMHGTVALVAQYCGVRVEDDGAETKLTPKTWEGVFKALSGHDYQQVVSCVWGLNEYNPQQRIADLKKGLTDRPVSKKK